MNNNSFVHILIALNILSYQLLLITPSEEKHDFKLNVEEPVFINLYKQRRALQLEALKGFQKLNSYEKQYSMAEILSNKIFSTIESSRAQLESSGYIPGVSEFPSDPEIKSALASVLENAALFGEIVLRLPDISSRLMRAHKEWEVLYQWSLTFLHESSYLIDKATLKLMDLVKQELNYTKRHPNFFNPYRITSKNTIKPNVNGSEWSPGKKERKKIHKGPMLSRAEL